MIDVYKSDLEGIGLGITTMNIADVGGHRLQGIEEDFCISTCLKNKKKNVEPKLKSVN